jgi:hypothetical protein
VAASVFCVAASPPVLMDSVAVMTTSGGIAFYTNTHTHTNKAGKHPGLLYSRYKEFYTPAAVESCLASTHSTHSSY